jgi:hypothetical protein
MFENGKKRPVRQKIYLRILNKSEEDGKTTPGIAKGCILGRPERQEFI